MMLSLSDPHGFMNKHTYTHMIYVTFIFCHVMLRHKYEEKKLIPGNYDNLNNGFQVTVNRINCFEIHLIITMAKIIKSVKSISFYKMDELLFQHG